MKKTINLKKYTNRKLYAPKGEIVNRGTYVNLADIHEFIKLGYNFKVTTYKTNEDVTNEVLKELILHKGIDLRTETLYRLIRG